ncbi:hypothetical protein ACFDTO_33335 [Microbacteriaceae bacterium 4G12]
MNTKLIIVEGLPGSGKSTTAHLINEVLTEMNIETELFLEGNLDHPADYDGVSCFTKKEFNELLSYSEECKDVLIDRVVKRGDYYLLPYRKMHNELDSKFSDELLQRVFSNDIYELPLDQHMELIEDKWTEFTESAFTNNKTYIFECCFIQNPITIGMVKYGASREKIINYITRLAKIIECLNPVLIYVEQDDLSFSFNKAIEERPNEWSQGFVDYYTSQGYGKEHSYTGIEGTLKVLEARKELETDIFDMLSMSKARINNSQYEIDNYKSKLIGILSNRK